MKKSFDVDGEKIRKERERRAWTQEQLSERSQLAVRTLRRIEAGNGSLESVRRVAEALELEPREALLPEVPPVARVTVPYDPLRVELSTSLLGSDSSVFVNPFIVRVGAIRRHIASEWGIVMPGVRFVDFRSPESIYRIVIRGVLMAESPLRHGCLMAIGGRDLAGLSGTPTTDPTYGMAGVWIEPAQRFEAEARGCMVFDDVSIVATHLTHLVKRNAHRLVGIEEVAALLDDLAHPRLVAEVIPSKATLTEVRSILRGLLEEGVSLVDLALILETIADHPGSVAERIEHSRRALREFICREHANRDGVIRAVSADTPDLRAICATMEVPIVLCAGDTRPRVRAEYRDEPGWIFLAEAEIAPRYRVSLVTL